AAGMNLAREADAVVGDAEPHLLGPGGERDGDVLRAAVADGVRDGLLRDAEEVGRVRDRIGAVVGVVRLDRAGDPEEALSVGAEPPERLREPVRLEVHRDEAAREGPRELVRLLDELRDLMRLPGGGRALGVEPAREAARDEPDPGELLPEAVVEVLPDPAAFVLRAPEHLAFEPPPLRDVADEAGDDRPALQLHPAHGEVHRERRAVLPAARVLAPDPDDAA